MGSEFNQPLGNSLSGLTNLKTLEFGQNFKQSLENSLSGLTNLESIRVGFVKIPISDIETITKI